MDVEIKPITASKAQVSGDSGRFVYESDAGKVKVLFYALPETKEVAPEDFSEMALTCVMKWKDLGYQHLVSAEITNPNVIKELAKLDGVRIFSGFDEVRPDDLCSLNPRNVSFDCSAKSTEESVGPYRISLPLNGPARPPFTWFEYDPATGKVLQTFHEKPDGCKYCHATELFEVGDEMINDHYFNPDTGSIFYSCKKNYEKPTVEQKGV